MARITIFRAARILVVALLCFSEVCLAENADPTGATTIVPTTTTEPTTTAPRTTTKPTTTAPRTTAKHTTTAAATTTRNSTTEPTNTTTSNMTTTISNMTTTTSNMTTTTSNITSTTPSATTSAPKARWQVRDKDGKLCMLMDFDGTITEVTRKNTVKIPSDATVSGNCSSSSHSAFFMDFSEGSGLTTQYWHIGLTFAIKGNSFELNEVKASWATFTAALSSSVSGNFIDVPVGNYYNCSDFNFTLSLFQINLTQPLFQPFVKKTKGGDNWGEAYQCRPPSASDSLALIIGVAVAAGIVIIAVIVVTVCLVKRRKSPSAKGYSHDV